MFGKIQITGKIEIMTGMHIGTSDGFAAIGAVDSPNKYLRHSLSSS